MKEKKKEEKKTERRETAYDNMKKARIGRKIRRGKEKNTEKEKKWKNEY